MNSATLFSDDLVQAVSVQEHHGGDREPVMRCGDVFLATAALGVCGVSSRHMLDMRSSDEQSGEIPERSRHCETPHAVQPDALPGSCRTNRQARVPEENHMNDATSRTLFGVGVGPGDPELVTVKTVRILREADVILVPYTEATTDGPGRAESIITAVAPDIAGRIRRIPFSMRERSGVGEKRKASWQVSSDAVVTAFDEGARTVALATVGDPTVFSTFTYLRANVEERLPDVTVELSPGITAMQALSAASGRPLVEGKEILALVPATVGINKLGQVLDLVDSVAIYKGGRKLPDVVEQLRSRDRQAVIGTDVTLESEQIITLDEVADAQTLPYFSTVLTTPERTTTGGKL